MSVLLIAGTAQAAPPANDNLSGAQLVGPVPVAVPATNVDATAEVDEPAHFNPAMSSIWYSWTSTFTGTAVIDVCDDQFPANTFARPDIAVYTGTNYGNLSADLASGTECILRFQALNGINYKVAVDFREDRGSFTFRLRQLTPPPNDNLAGAQVVASVPASIPGTNVDSTWESGEPSMLGGSGGARSVWYRWTAPAAGKVRASVCDFETRAGAGNHSLGVFTGNAFPLTTVAEAETNNCTVDFQAAAGVNYKFGFSGNFKGEGDFTFDLRFFTPPANDSFAAATDLGTALPVELQGDNDFASVEPGEPSHGGSSGDPYYSVWYRWQAPSDGAVRIVACSETGSRRLGVYTGDTLGTLVAAGTDPGFSPYCSKVVPVTGDTVYRIAVGGGPFDGARGPFTLDIHTLARPANDDFANARTIGPALPVSVTGTTVDATRETGEQGIEGYGANASVWYRWTPDRSQPVSLFACDATRPINLGVFVGGAIGSLGLIAAGNPYENACSPGSDGVRLTFDAVGGHTYSIAADAQLRDIEPEFTLKLESLLPPGPLPGPPGPGGPSGGPGPAADPIAKCKKRFKGKSKAARRKRAKCIRKAKLRAAVKRCKSRFEAGEQRARCIKRAREKFAPRPAKQRR